MKKVRASQIAAFRPSLTERGFLCLFRFDFRIDFQFWPQQSTATAAFTQGGAVSVKTVATEAGPGVPARKG
jgi:hypothetical protein